MAPFTLQSRGGLEKEMATHSSILAWEILWTEKPGLQSMGSQRVGHDLATKLPHQQRWLKTAAWWQVHRAVGLCCSETRRRMCVGRPCLKVQQWPRSFVCDSPSIMGNESGVPCTQRVQRTKPRQSLVCWPG